MGVPTIHGVTLNVAGKSHLLNAGDVVKVDLGEARSCQVTVQSFDMFKVVIHATCATDGM
jgi:hypothetical protein